MGVYLSEPETSKKIEKGSKDKMAFCAAEMQGIVYHHIGWRKNMEDASITEVDLGDGNSLFGVFDGHGGNYFPYSYRN